MKQLPITIIVLFVSIHLFAQNSVEDFVKQGIQYHDNGDYDNALNAYKRALELNPKSTLANYEIALTYFTKGDYEMAIEYSNIVLKQNTDHLLQAYITKGSALDVLGKTKESIKLFKTAIRKTEGSYLLYYNLALNYFKINDLKNSEINVIKAIEENPNHTSSHLILANIHNNKRNSVQTILATHYFLFLEPNSQRSLGAYQMLRKNFNGNVTTDENNSNTVITLSKNNDSQFSAVELMISLLQASKSQKDNKDETDIQSFTKNTESFFTILGELKKENSEEIWWNFYTTFFYRLAQSEHLETYCNYISQSGDENSKKWLIQNEGKLTEFDNWLKDD